MSSSTVSRPALISQCSVRFSFAFAWKTGRGAVIRRWSEGSFVATCFADPLLTSSLATKSSGDGTAAIAQTQMPSVTDAQRIFIRDPVSVSGHAAVYRLLLQNSSEIALDGLDFDSFAA